MPAKSARAASPPQDLLLVRVGAGTYAVDAETVRRLLPAPTGARRLGGSGDGEGVIEVDGELVPLLNLKTRLGMRPGYRGAGRLVVIEWAGRKLALMVDAVTGVRSAAGQAPQGGLSAAAKVCGFVPPLSTEDGQGVGLLQVDKLLSPGEWARLRCLLAQRRATASATLQALDLSGGQPPSGRRPPAPFEPSFAAGQ
jgi:chemotaxis signal transduction protein